jgi:F-type H+-transporting ATPase subunit a
VTGLGLFNNFAAESGVPPAAETVFNVGGVNITNSILMGFVVAGLMIFTFGYLARHIRIKPTSKLTFTLESIVTFVSSSLESALGSQDRVRKFLPLFLAFFVYILANNLFGLLPGMGGSIYVESEGLKAALLRPVTTDLNGTLALALIAMFTAQYFAIRERGGLGHLKHYFTVMQPWWNPINAFIGFTEILGEFVRLITLALRLFGVIYAGEVLLHVIAGLSGVFGPVALLPIVLMEIFFSLIQAYLFTMLSATYLSIGLAHDESTPPYQPESQESTKSNKSKENLAAVNL